MLVWMIANVTSVDITGRLRLEWMDCWRSSYNFLFKSRVLDWVIQGLVKLILKICSNRESITSLGDLSRCLIIIKFFLHFICNRISPESTYALRVLSCHSYRVMKRELCFLCFCFSYFGSTMIRFSSLSFQNRID